jgi:molybdate transport system substrate-binding protein
MWKKTVLLVLIAITVILTGCEKKEKSLVIYSGQGLKIAVDEIMRDFEQRYGIKISVIYAGSDTLLSTIQKTKKGDVFIPGSLHYIEKAGDLVASSQYIARHVPAFIVRSDNSKGIASFEALSRSGVRIAVGNKDMCAIGRVADKIVSTPDMDIKFAKNITITASTVNELLDLVIRKEVDASLVWSDMLKWPVAAELEMVEIPPAINQIKEIHTGVLTITADRKSADMFAGFMAGEGRAIFRKYGFGE